jgi:hypothetical protein
MYNKSFTYYYWSLIKHHPAHPKIKQQAMNKKTKAGLKKE